MSDAPLRPRPVLPLDRPPGTLQAIEVHVTAPSLDTAEAIGQALVTERLAACAQIVPGIRSIYRWKGKVELDTEAMLVIKTTPERYQALERRVKSMHPYEVPEVVVLPILGGSPQYLDWLAAQVEGP